MLQRCFQETLRIEPPITVSTTQRMTKEVTINNITFKKDTEFAIGMYSLHHDPTQWQQPEKFVPDRFDPNSEWSKTPSGGVRHPMTFGPFLGGKRICLGKTFAEVTVRFTIPILYHFFDFKIVNSAHLIEKPRVHVTGRESQKIPVKLIYKRKA